MAVTIELLHSCVSMAYEIDFIFRESEREAKKERKLRATNNSEERNHRRHDSILRTFEGGFIVRTKESWSGAVTMRVAHMGQKCSAWHD